MFQSARKIDTVYVRRAREEAEEDMLHSIPMTRSSYRIPIQTLIQTPTPTPRVILTLVKAQMRRLSI